jgi:aspartate racemase
MSRVLGVLGGMGPAATLDFLGKLQALTPVERDEDHIRVLVDINPQIPVRAERAGGLQGAGAQVLAIACDSAHVHADLISRASGLPLVDMIETASRAARDSGARRAGVLGARDAVRLYHEYIAAQGMGLVTLPRDDQARFMDLVGRIKAGDLGAAVREGMRQLAEVLVREGAEAVIAGCTEVPLVLDPGDVRAPLIDAGEELARRCVSVCLGLEPLPQGR